MKAGTRALGDRMVEDVRDTRRHREHNNYTTASGFDDLGLKTVMVGLPGLGLRT
jgi:hypothetical protein